MEVLAGRAVCASRLALPAARGRVQLQHGRLKVVRSDEGPDTQCTRERFHNGAPLFRPRRMKDVIHRLLLARDVVPRVADADPQSPEIAGPKHFGRVGAIRCDPIIRRRI